MRPPLLRILVAISLVLVALIGGMFYYIQVNDLGSISSQPAGESQSVRDSLEEGNTTQVVPQYPEGEEGSQPLVVHKVETETGEVILFGKFMAFENNSLVMDYEEGTETVTITSETKIIYFSQDYLQGETKTADFLETLTYPQTGDLSYVSETKEALSINVIELPKNN